MPNPVEEFELFQRRRLGYSPLEESDRTFGLRRRIVNRVTPVQRPIPEVLEEAGLLEESTPLLTTAVEAETALTTGEAVALGTGAAVTTGAGIKAIYDIYKASKGATLPGHEYIGPGNTLKGQIPVDADDIIAKKHDEAYDKAKTVEDVQKADDIAIHTFDKDFEETGNIHSKVGSFGLRAKQAVEHITGPLYPNLGIYIIVMAHAAPTADDYEYWGISMSIPRLRRLTIYKSLTEPDPKLAYSYYLATIQDRYSDQQIRTGYNQWALKRSLAGLEIDVPNKRHRTLPVEQEPNPDEQAVWDEWANITDDRLNEIATIVENEMHPLSGQKRKSDISHTESSDKRAKTSIEQPGTSGYTAPTSTTLPTTTETMPTVPHTTGPHSGGHITPATGGEGMDTGEAPQPLNPTVGGGASKGGMATYTLGRPSVADFSYSKHFKQQHKFYSFGLAWKPFNVAIPAVADPNGIPAYTIHFMTSGLAEIPVHKLALYMTPGEFNTLHPGAYVKRVKVTVYQRNPVMQFETGGTDSKLATLNQNKNCMYAVGLNLTGYGRNMCPNGYNVTNNMVPTSYLKPIYEAGTYSGTVVNYEGLANDLWGYTTSAAQFSTNTPKSLFGQGTTLKNYWVTATTSLEQTKGGWPNMRKYLNEYDGADNLGQKVCEYVYEPKLAPITKPLTDVFLQPLGNNATAGTEMPNKGRAIISNGTGFDGGDRMEWPLANTASTSIQDTAVLHIEQNEFYNADATLGYTEYDYEKQQLEKSSVLQYGFRHERSVKTQPSLHIGINAAPSLDTISANATNTDFVNLRAYWDVETEIWIGWRERNELAHDTTFHVPPSDQIMTYANTQTTKYDPDQTNFAYAGMLRLDTLSYDPSA